MSETARLQSPQRERLVIPATLTPFEDVMEAVEIEVDPLSSTVYLPVAKVLVNKVRAQARQQGVSSETLVNLWLQARLAVVA